ncbi:MAG: lamin tail domain-containing protein [Patescibacteria group bacterium]
MKFLIFSFVIFVFPIFVNAQVLINEIAWMGNEVSANKEWIELWNNSGESVNLDGWKLYSKDNIPNIVLSKSMLPQGFFILERADDLTLPNINADLIYKGALGNSGEHLILKNSNNNIIDEIDAITGWFSGDKTNKQTMQLTFGNSVSESGGLEKIWITALATPKKSNEIAYKSKVPNYKSQTNSNDQISNNQNQSQEIGDLEQIEQSVTELPIVESRDVVQNREVIDGKTEYQTVNVDYKIFISEFMPNPEGSDGEEEWIEIFNNGDKSIDLGGFILDDIEGASSKYIIPFGTIIYSNGFLVFKRKDTKIALNNTDDMVRLLYPSGEILAQISYDKALENYSASLNTKDNKFYWTENITPGEVNIEIGSQKITIKNGDIKQDISGVELSKVNSNLEARAGGLNLKTQASKGAIIWSIIIGIMIGIFGVLAYQKLIQN